MNRICLLIIIVVAAVLYFVFNKQSVKDTAIEVEHKAEAVINDVKDVAEDVKEVVIEDAKKVEAAAEKLEEAAAEKVEEAVHAVEKKAEEAKK